MKKIQITWHTLDVLSKAKTMDVPLTEQEADDILQSLKDNHDAQIGINWDVVESYINQHQDEKLSNNLYDLSAE